jgi:hypothetical protein
MKEELTTIEIVLNSWIFKTTIGTIITTMIGWALISARNTNKKINNAASKADVNKAKMETFKYVDDKLKIHEDKQILELSTIIDKVSATHTMVGKLLDIQLNKGK